MLGGQGGSCTERASAEHTLNDVRACIGLGRGEEGSDIDVDERKCCGCAAGAELIRRAWGKFGEQGQASVFRERRHTTHKGDSVGYQSSVNAPRSVFFEIIDLERYQD